MPHRATIIAAILVFSLACYGADDSIREGWPPLSSGAPRGSGGGSLLTCRNLIALVVGTSILGGAGAYLHFRENPQVTACKNRVRAAVDRAPFEIRAQLRRIVDHDFRGVSTVEDCELIELQMNALLAPFQLFHP